jgi:hypothetical protein
MAAIGIDWRVTRFTFVVSLATSVVFGGGGVARSSSTRGGAEVCAGSGGVGCAGVFKSRSQGSRWCCSSARTLIVTLI